MARVHLTDLGVSNDLQKNPGSLGFPGCALLALVRPVPPTLVFSLQRSRSVSRPVVLDVQFSLSPRAVFRAGDVSAFGRWVQTDPHCNPIPGLPLWALALVTRSLLSCGRWFLTHWRYPQSALDRWCLWLLRSIGAQTQAAGLSFVSSPPLLQKLQVIYKIPKFPQNTTVSKSMPS